MSLIPEKSLAPLDARLEATARELRRVRLHAAHALHETEQRAAAFQQDLAAVSHDPLRLWVMRQRRRLIAPLKIARHPIRACRGLLDGVATATHLHHVGPILEPVWRRSSPLRPAAISDSDTHGQDAGAVRWLGPVASRDVIRQALFAHPPSTVTWTATLERGATFVAHCMIVPAVMDQRRGGVVFRATVSSAAEGWSVEASRVVHPQRNWLDRHWRTLKVVLPADASGLVTIQLRTDLPPNAPNDYAWALWGDPRFTWRQPAADVARLAVALVRRDGVLGTLRRLRQKRTDDKAADYQRWLVAHTPSADDLARMGHASSALAWKPLFSVITPVFNTDPAWLRACVDSVQRQVYPHWELCLVDDASTSEATRRALDEIAKLDPRISVKRMPKNSHISAASNAGLDMAQGEFVALLDHDDELAPDALFEIASLLNTRRDLDFIYTDEDKRDLAGVRCDPSFKPDWAPEQFLNFMYTNHLMVLRRSVVDAVGRFRIGFEGSQDFDLALRVIEKTDRVGHVPKVLYHWRRIPGSAAAETEAKPWALDAARRALVSHLERTGMKAEVLDGTLPGLFRVKRKIAGAPLVTIVIPTDDRSREVNGRMLPLLPTCVRSVAEKTAYANYELLIIDNGRISEETLDVLATIPHRRVSYRIDPARGAFNFAHKLNWSVSHARGEHLVIFNDDLDVITPEWLTALLEYSQDPAIGAVGAKLFFPDGRLQHVGMVMGVCGVAAHAFHLAPGEERGNMAAALGPRNYSAVTGACMMTRRALFHEMGGFNERLAIDFNDTDYCLRLRRAGYRIVYTPYAQLYHYESGSHGARTQNPEEAAYMRAAWPDVIARDPYYNPNFTRDFPDYRLGE